MKLTAKQQRFCEEYIVDLNGTQAAIRAGYSKKTANEISAQNLAKVSIQSVITDLKKKISEKTGITAERVLREYEKIGFSNIQDYISSDNQIIDISSIDRDKAAVVESIKTTETTESYGKVTNTKKQVHIRLISKLNALDAIGKHIGLFEKDNEQKNKVLIPPTLNFNGGNPGKRS